MMPPTWVAFDAFTSVDIHTQLTLTVEEPITLPISPAEWIPPVMVPFTCRFLMVASFT